MEKNSKLKTILICLGAAAIFILSLHLTGMVIERVFEMPDDEGNVYLPTFIGELFGLATAMIFLKLTNKLGILKERGKGLLAGFFAGLYLLCVSCMALFANIVSKSLLAGTFPKFRPFSHIVTFTLCMISVGLAEEFIFRGVIQNCLMDAFGPKTKGNTFIALAISSVIFGLIHLTNAFSGVSVEGAFYQAISVIGAGFYMGAIYIRTNNIWCNVILHAFLDFAGLASTGLLADGGKLADSISGTSPFAIIGGVIYLGIAIFLLRRSQVDYVDNTPKYTVTE